MPPFVSAAYVRRIVVKVYDANLSQRAKEFLTLHFVSDVLGIFALQNIHEHQVNFMGAYEKQGGIAFFLIYYSHKDFLYYLPYKDLLKFWTRAREGGRKSFRMEELNMKYAIPKRAGVLVPYLDTIALDLEERENT